MRRIRGPKGAVFFRSGFSPNSLTSPSFNLTTSKHEIDPTHPLRFSHLAQPGADRKLFVGVWNPWEAAGALR